MRKARNETSLFGHDAAKSERMANQHATPQKVWSVFLMALYAFLLGAVAGALIRSLLYLLDLGIEFLWTVLPNRLGYTKLYTLGLCTGGGVLIGIFQSKFGILPDTMEEVRSKLKRDGRYGSTRLRDLPILIVAILLPLLFGGTLGPEAGLTGLIVTLCCLIRDRLKSRAIRIRELSEAGITAVLGVIFGAPLFGILSQLEHPKENTHRFFGHRALRLSKIIVYAFGTVGGMLSSHVLTCLLGEQHGLPRFPWEGTGGFFGWTWFLPITGCGIALGLLYYAFRWSTGALGACIKSHRCVSCIIAGSCLGLLGALHPTNLFSGESQLLDLASQWQTMPVRLLLLTAVTKLLCTCLCVALGWKGGSIFPIIYCGTSLGYALAALTGVQPLFAVATATSACYSYILRKPLTVTAILFLCFPLRMVLPILAAAYLAVLIPRPGSSKSEPSPVDERRRDG